MGEAISVPDNKSNPTAIKSTKLLAATIQREENRLSTRMDVVIIGLLVANAIIHRMTLLLHSQRKAVLYVDSGIHLHLEIHVQTNRTTADHKSKSSANPMNVLAASNVHAHT